MDTDLRNALQEVVNSGKPWHHVIHIAALQERFPHTIEVVKELSTRDGEAFNCFMFALGVHEDQWARDAYATVRDDVFSSTIIGEAISKHGIMFESRGDIVVYSNDMGEFKHMGQMQRDGIVTSKWGIGHLWRHALFEVPTLYGDTVRYLSNEQGDKIIDYLHNLYCALSRRSE